MRYIYDTKGTMIGKVDEGINVTYYDANGKQIARSTGLGPMLFLYDIEGKQIGKTFNGSTYDKDNRLVGPGNQFLLIVYPNINKATL